MRNGLALTSVLAAASSVAALAPAAAVAASPARTSVVLHLASPGIIVGNVGSANASCVSHRSVRFEVRKGRKWVTESVTRTNSSGTFTIRLHGARAGSYMVSVAAKGSCSGAQARHLSSTKSGGTGGLGGLGGNGGNGAGGNGGNGGSGATKCSLPITHDTLDGFHVGVPSGWELLTMHGQLVVAPSPTADEGVIILPAAKTNGLTAASFFQSELPTFESELTTAPTVTGTGTENGEPYANFTVTAGGNTGQGTATVVTRQDGAQTQFDFVAYWSPQSSFATESPTLSAVVGCYGPEAGSLFQVYQDQAFTYTLPTGWTVDQESQDQLVLGDGQGDVLTYELVAGSPSQFTTPQSLASLILSMDGVASVSTVWDASSPAQAGGDAGYEQEFTGTWNGQPVHGLIYAASQTSSDFSTGYYRLVIAKAASWNSLNGAMVNMVGSIQHDFTQDLEEINQLNQQWQNFSGQVANFDDTLNNQQLVQNPTTGKLYEAPYSTYSDGPQGPGYYLSTSSGEQLLNQVERQ
jgi:hypothetical protein